MIRLYVQNPNSLILAISPANYDIANSDSLKIAREVDPSGVRTLGVLTKMDLIDDENTITGLLNGSVYPLDLGYYCLRCRNQTELEKGVQIKDALANETNFFDSNPRAVFRKFRQKMGTQAICTELSSF